MNHADRNADMIARIHELRARLMTNREMAAEMGVQQKSLENFISRHGIARPMGERQQARMRPKTTKQTQRPCLCGCGQKFTSTHIGERIRPKCRAVWSERT